MYWVEYNIDYSPSDVAFRQGGRQDLPDGGLGSPTGGLNNRIEGIFLCNVTQFSVKNSPTDTKSRQGG